MKKFQGILFLTDLDGTLLRHDKSISEENLRAIEYFMAEGGLFSFITGRAPVAMRMLYERICPNAPVGCFNGGGVYDVTQKKMLWSVTIPRTSLELAAFVEELFPDVGIEVFTTEQIYFCRSNARTEKHRRDEELSLLERDFRDINEPLVKILFAAESDRIRPLADALAAHPAAKEFNLMQTDPNYYEVLPRGIDKANSVLRLSELLGDRVHTVIAVGDNDNDAPMLRAADIGYAVANASPLAKAAASRHTVSNEEHAIAAIINTL